MKSIIALVFSLILFYTTGTEKKISNSHSPFPAANSTSVMSYNIDKDDGHSKLSWKDRRIHVAQIIRSKKPQILGVQEATLSQTVWLKEQVSGYDWYALEDKSNSLNNSLCPIFYRPDSYKLEDKGSFWLSSEAHPANQSAAERKFNVVNWVKLEHLQTMKTIYAFNTQFPPEVGIHKMEAARSLMERVDGITNGETFILLGDLNCEPDHEAVKSISTWAKDSKESSLVNTSNRDHTYYPNQEKGKRLDYVFLSKDISTNSYEVLDVEYNSRFPSDHLPVFCRIRLE